VAEFAGEEGKRPRQPVRRPHPGQQAEGEAAQGDGGKEPAYHAGEYARNGGTEARRTQRETRRERSANHPEWLGRDQMETGREVREANDAPTFPTFPVLYVPGSRALSDESPACRSDPKVHDRRGRALE
jgi:hypothetical protein